MACLQYVSGRCIPRRVALSGAYTTRSALPKETQRMRIYVGGFSSVISNDQLRTLFSLHGSVTSAHVLMNKHTGQSRGFGFIEMGSVEETQSAIAALNGTDLE